MEYNHPPHIDIRQAAHSGQLLQGDDLLSNYERLAEFSQGLEASNVVHWQARFERRADATAALATWLRLALTADVDLVCQRCLAPVAVPVVVERDFRFVATEAQALQQDDEVDEDLLVISREFDLAELVEDEILLALPLVPSHAVCPVPVKLATADDDFEAATAKPNPFAALAKLKGGSR
ncbi:MAG: YceD family protein [Rhodoferax sp.]|nr:YceD family protein [Rhodoferax sp.]